MYHVAAFTNCDSVGLFLNGAHVRVSAPDAEEHIAHFYVPYAPGTLRAEGYLRGEKACEDRLVTTDAPAHLALRAFEGRELIQVEALLLDAEGQVYTRARPLLRAEAEGADVLKLSSGDFLATDDLPRMHEGHMLIVLKPTGADKIRLRACADGVPEAQLLLTYAPVYGYTNGV